MLGRPPQRPIGGGILRVAGRNCNFFASSFWRIAVFFGEGGKYLFLGITWFTRFDLPGTMIPRRGVGGQGVFLGVEQREYKGKGSRRNNMYNFDAFLSS